MDLFLGIDAGGTSTRALLTTSTGERAGYGLAGGGNPAAHGVDAALAEITTAVKQALGATDPGRVVNGVIGLAGLGALEDPAVHAAFSRAWADCGLHFPVRGVEDPLLAFVAGTPDPSGHVLLSGTGAVALRVADRRVTEVADGQGWLLGDEGSGFWLGRAAARHAIRHLTTPPTHPMPDMSGNNSARSGANEIGDCSPAGQPDAVHAPVDDAAQPAVGSAGGLDAGGHSGSVGGLGKAGARSGSVGSVGEDGGRPGSAGSARDATARSGCSPVKAGGRVRGSGVAGAEGELARLVAEAVVGPGVELSSRTADLMIIRAQAAPVTTLAPLAPLVGQAAEAGDPAAAAILESAADRLLATLARVRAPEETSPIVLAGGVLTAQGPLRERVRRLCEERWATSVAIAGDTAAAAAWLAAGAHGAHANWLASGF
ncbi:N-acetylglucosamine kinase [Nonomuraea salmonea]|uniref:N-acetylglucosamine kinase n=1 Tax=Nonomuraea salmonea TaxID=46181 RepID=A0ABV5P0B6_9ACTN